MRLAQIPSDLASEDEARSHRPVSGRCVRSLLGCALLAVLSAAPGHAHETPESFDPLMGEEAEVAVPEWNPVPPDEEYWDWVRLTSDEWLKGRILRFRDERL
jgi:hypothetical protein